MQGEHVELMSLFILGAGIEIGFAHNSFKWENDAKSNVGVTVVVIRLRAKNTGRSTYSPMVFAKR